jgi:hypothetical protein
MDLRRTRAVRAHVSVVAPPWCNDRGTKRFALEATDPGTQLGDRERCLFDAFIIDERESSELIVRAVADATAHREGMQLISDQGHRCNASCFLGSGDAASFVTCSR